MKFAYNFNRFHVCVPNTNHLIYILHIYNRTHTIDIYQTKEYRHIEGGEASPAGGASDDCDCRYHEEIFCTDEDFECEGAATPLYNEPYAGHNDNDDDGDGNDLLSPVQFDYNFGQTDEQSRVNRILGYRNHPELFIDDDQAGFPGLHEIGETIDELQLIMHAYIMKFSLSI